MIVQGLGAGPRQGSQSWCQSCNNQGHGTWCHTQGANEGVPKRINSIISQLGFVCGKENTILKLFKQCLKCINCNFIINKINSSVLLSFNHIF